MEPDIIELNWGAEVNDGVLTATLRVDAADFVRLVASNAREDTVDELAAGIGEHLLMEVDAALVPHIEELVAVLDERFPADGGADDSDA